MNIASNSESNCRAESINVILLKDFLTDVKQLRKRYRRVEDDVEELVAEMERGDFRGVLMPGYNRDVYKVRLANRSARRGRRGGFRIIYSLVNVNTVAFLHIYSKSDKSDVSEGEISCMLSDLE